jgi:hypothetical protein
MPQRNVGSQAGLAIQRRYVSLRQQGNQSAIDVLDSVLTASRVNRCSIRAALDRAVLDEEGN